MLAPVRDPVALDRSKRPPRSVARPATFLGETAPDPWEPRCGFANKASFGGPVMLTSQAGAQSYLSPRVEQYGDHPACCLRCPY